MSDIDNKIKRLGVMGKRKLGNMSEKQWKEYLALSGEILNDLLALCRK